MPPVGNSIATLLITIVLFFVIWTVVNETLDQLVDEEPIVDLPEGYMKGTIEFLSPIESGEFTFMDDTGVEGTMTLSYCNIIFEGDLNEYSFFNINEGQWDLLSTAKYEREEITLKYNPDVKISLAHVTTNPLYLEEVGTNIEIPQPPEEPYEFPWMVIAIPVAVLILSYICFKAIPYAYDRYQYNKEHKEEIERKQKEIEEKRKQKEFKKQKQKQSKERELYKKDGRTSRVAKAAQMLDQKEGKNKRR